MVSDHWVPPPKERSQTTVLDSARKNSLLHISTARDYGNVVFGTDGKTIITTSRRAEWMKHSPNITLSVITHWARNKHFDLWLMSIMPGEEEGVAQIPDNFGL